jgi:hypothetical protein
MRAAADGLLPFNARISASPIVLPSISISIFESVDDSADPAISRSSE